MLEVLWILTRNELRGQLRSKAGLFWAFAFPVLLLAVMLLAFGRSSSLGTVDLAVDGALDTALARTCRPALEAAFASGDPVRARWTAHAGDAAVQVTFPAAPGQPVSVAYDFNGPLAAKAASRIVEMALARCEAARLGVEDVVRFVDDARSPPPLAPGAFFTTGILVMALMSIGIISTATSLASLRERNIFKICACFPVSRAVFLAALIAARAVLMLASGVTLVAVAVGVFGLGLPLAGPAALRAVPVLLLGSAMLLSLGTLLASRARSLAQAELWCHLSYYPLLFFSDLTIPMTAAPGWLRSALAWLPTRQLVDVLRALVVRGEGYAQVATPLAAIAGWTLLFFTAAASTFRWHRD